MLECVESCVQVACAVSKSRAAAECEGDLSCSEDLFTCRACSISIIYMNGKVAKVGHDAKPAPGCEIIVPSKPKRDGRTLAEILTIGTSVASIATMIATLANILK